MDLKRQKRNAYMRQWTARFRKKYGVSPSVKWRRENPDTAKTHRETEKRRWHNNPDARRRHKEKGEIYRLSLKFETLGAYGGANCACCGEDHIAFLTLDHVNNDGGKHRKSIADSGFAGQAFYNYLRSHGFPNDPPLQVLCYNCNCGKRANSGICPHKDLK